MSSRYASSSTALVETSGLLPDLALNRFGRDPRAGLFSAYDAQQRPKSQSASPSPYRPNSYSYSYTATAERQFHSSSNPAFGAYPDSANGGPSSNSFRPATLNKKGQYSDAVLNELESQNEAQLEGMSAKVRMLKDVRGLSSWACLSLFLQDLELLRLMC